MDPKEPAQPSQPTRPSEPSSVVVPPFNIPAPEAQSPSPTITPTPDVTPPPLPIETPSPAPTPTEPVFRGAKTGNDLGYLAQEPTQPAPSPTPNNGVELQTPLGDVTRANDEPFIDEHNIHPQPPILSSEEQPATSLTDLNPNWKIPVAPEVHDAMADAKTTGVYVPKDGDTQPIDMKAVQRIIAEKGLQPSAAPNPEPAPTPESWPLPTTNQPEQPPSQPQTLEQTPPAVNPAGLLDAMGQPNFVPLASAAELSGGPNFFDRIKTQNTQPTAQTTIETPAPQVQNRSWIDKIFGRNK